MTTKETALTSAPQGLPFTVEKLTELTVGNCANLHTANNDNPDTMYGYLRLGNKGDTKKTVLRGGGANSCFAGKIGIRLPQDGSHKDPIIDLAIGDNDTGLQQQGDGELAIYTNNEERIRINKYGYIPILTEKIEWQ